MTAAGPAAGQVGGDLPCGVPAGQGGDVGGLRGVHEVARREHARARDVAMVVSIAGPRVPASSAMPAVRASTWSGIQSPVNTSHSQSTVRARLPARPPRPRRPPRPAWPAEPPPYGHVHRGEPASRAGYPGHGGRRPDGDVPAQRGAEREGGVAGVPRLVGDEGEHPGTRVREGQRGGEAHVLRAHHERAAFQAFAGQVDALLQLAGGEHA